jgi:hypothetical protein
VNRRAVDTAAHVGIVLAGVAVLVAPALLLNTEVLDAGAGSLDDDILAASVLVGAGHAVLAWRRLRAEPQRTSRLIAALNGLVVLALVASLLLLAVLVKFPDEHLTLDQREAPLVVMWAGIQLVAVGLAEAAARGTYRWISGAAPPPRAA